MPRIHPIGGEPTEMIRRSKISPEDQEFLRCFQSASEWESTKDLSSENHDYYFNSYASVGIHEEMLKDSVRTNAYKKAIMENRHVFKDKIVLDVGAGTGILSMFCAAAGAKHVYSIEYSGIAEMATALVHHNNLSDKITVIRGLAEEIELPVDKVDIIVSEWMGYFLLYESMLDTVIHCRDKWLKPGGLIFPDKVTMHVALLEDFQFRLDKFDFWDTCYGFSYTPMKALLLQEPLVDCVNAENIVSEPYCVFELDVTTCTREALDFASVFELKFTRKDWGHALVAWFDCTFGGCHVPVVFSTSPHCEYTHWKQTVFEFAKPVAGRKGDVVKGALAVRKNAKNPRHIDVKLFYEACGENGPIADTLFYTLR